MSKEMEMEMEMEGEGERERIRKVIRERRRKVTQNCIDDTFHKGFFPKEYLPFTKESFIKALGTSHNIKYIYTMVLSLVKTEKEPTETNILGEKYYGYTLSLDKCLEYSGANGTDIQDVESYLCDINEGAKVIRGVIWKINTNTNEDQWQQILSYINIHYMYLKFIYNSYGLTRINIMVIEDLYNYCIISQDKSFGEGQ